MDISDVKWKKRASNIIKAELKKKEWGIRISVKNCNKLESRKQSPVSLQKLTGVLLVFHFFYNVSVSLVLIPYT